MTTTQQFSEGQIVTWTGSDHQFSRRVRVRDVRQTYVPVAGQVPSAAEFVYDLEDLERPDSGMVYGIPGNQLSTVEQ